jgi:peptidoglycan hydrolase CwlO-like protein
MLKENQMLQRITKLFNKKEDIEMKDEKAETTLSLQVDSAALEKLQADFEAFKAEANALIAQADADNTELKKQVQVLQSEKSQMIAEATAKKLADRKAKVEAAIGENEKVEKLLAATEAMEDAAFEAIVSALNTSAETEAKSEMFTEKGVAATADASKIDVDPVQKLAAKVAAKLNPIKE